MGQNIAEKLISAHLVGGSMKPGAEAALRIDQTLAQDATGTVGTNYVFNGSGVRPVNGTQLRVTSTGLPISTAVPEPGTWAMMIVGFGLVGSMVRSVRRGGLGGQPVAGQT